MPVESRRNATDGDARLGAEPAQQEAWARQIEIVVQSLQGRLGAVTDAARIRAEVEAAFAGYSDARVRDFVPIRVEAQVRSRLLQAPLS